MQKGGEWLENWPGQNLTQPEPIAIKEIHVKKGLRRGFEKELKRC